MDILDILIINLKVLEYLKRKNNKKDKFYSDFPRRIKKFYANEPRAFCYDLSLSLINKAKKESNKNWYYHNKTIEGILLLIYCWNFATPKTKKLTKQRLKKLLKNCKNDLKYLESYSILNFNNNTDVCKKILGVFKKFKEVFGQTGASKALSLLNTKLFIMWDTKIRTELRKLKIVSKINNGKKPEHYIKFMGDIKEVIEIEKLNDRIKNSNEIAKKIDEFHFAKIVIKKNR